MRLVILLPPSVSGDLWPRLAALAETKLSWPVETIPLPSSPGQREDLVRELKRRCEEAPAAVITDDRLTAERLDSPASRVLFVLDGPSTPRGLKLLLVRISGFICADETVRDTVVKGWGFPAHAAVCLSTAVQPPERDAALRRFLEERLDPRPSVLVPIFDGVISKNIVDSGALEPVREAGYRVVLWGYEWKGGYYRERYGSKGYAIAEYGAPRIPLLATYLQNFAIDSIPTRALYLKHRRRMAQKHKYLLGWLRIALWGICHARPCRWIVQRLPLLWPVPLKVKALVRVERPSLIFCPNMVWLAEVQLTREAKRLRIPTVGMDKSWDNITTKLMLPVKPDRLIVPTPRCVEEAVRYLDYPREKTTVVGLAQFDRYHETALQESREAFSARAGLDPRVPILLYCAAGLWMAPDEPDIIRQLDADIARGAYGPLQILVRLHPKYDCGADRLTDLQHTVLDRPGTYLSGNLTQWEYEDADLKHLISSIRYSAVTVNTASTMTIEAAYFDRPIVNIGYDPKPAPWALSVARYYEREHYAPMLKTGGVRLAGSYDELAAAVKDYLRDPALDHAGRERIVEEQCVSREPVAGRRIAQVLLEACQGPRLPQ